MEELAERAPVARLIFSGEESQEQGWYLVYSVNGETARQRLDIEVGADAFGAVAVAARFLGCLPEQIQVEGCAWPKPLHGLIPA